ncbi:MAG: HD domain-containing protein [Candidatus Marinimicrobia bacterium]|nr:HD domain-containing protein [Candidatus Neomarinimicrobiota bacterium]MCF7903557.1 HD domain-containing protein [Candidatus Neomarinimicrobiota bacterium]
MTNKSYINRSDVKAYLEKVDPEVLDYINQCEVQIDNLAEIGYQLSYERDLPTLLNLIIVEGMRITNADGGTLYLRTDDDRLAFEIMKNKTMGTDFGGISETPIPDQIYPVKLYTEDGEPNHHNVSAYVGLTGNTLNIPDAYENDEFDFSGAKGFDQRFGYRSQSFLTIAMKNHENDIIGVLQLLNATNPGTGQVIPFSKDTQKLIESLASQAAVAITNVRLIEGLENLLESFIQLIADAIDEKSPYTGGHCSRVPAIAMMLAEKVNETKEGQYADVQFTKEDMDELRIAAWLHDVGKITTPEYVVDKATKLETIYDRVHELNARFEILKRDAEIEYLKAIQADPDQKEQYRDDYDARLIQLESDRLFLNQCNTGGEFMADELKDRVKEIAKQKIVLNGEEQDLLSEDWVMNLNISRGTLTNSERDKINDHIVVTIDMLEKLPFPKHLKRVPEFAGGHHETMIGTGYPKGLTKDDMSIQARIMGIADIFEALTASDRPYKKGKTLSEAMRIMGFFKIDHHIDPDLFDVFLKEKVYREYADEYLDPKYIDEVDEQKYIEMQPKELD